jgi:hypothetical protein
LDYIYIIINIMSVSKCDSQIGCDDQAPFRPSQDKSLTCDAICTSTGRKCRNCPVETMRSAVLVMEMSGCCKLCKIHREIAKKKWSVWIKTNTVAVTSRAIESMISRFMGSEAYNNATLNPDAGPFLQDTFVPPGEFDYEAGLSNITQRVQNLRRPPSRKERSTASRRRFKNGKHVKRVDRAV